MAEVSIDACRGKALAVLLLVFVGGAASGMIGSHVFQSVTPATPVVKTPDDLAETNLGAVEHLRQELVLDAAQVQHVRDILDQCIMHEADLMLQIRVNQNSARERIMKILNPEQRSRFQSELFEASTEHEASF